MLAVVAFIVWTVVALAVGLTIGAMVRLADAKQAEQQPETDVERWDCAA